MAQQQRICLQCRRLEFDPWVGKIPWRSIWQSTPVFLAGENPMDRRVWQATVHGVAKSRTWLRTGTHTHFIENGCVSTPWRTRHSWLTSPPSVYGAPVGRYSLSGCPMPRTDRHPLHLLLHQILTVTPYEWYISPPILQMWTLRPWESLTCPRSYS